MGHGASSAAVCNVDTLFVSQELRTGIKALKEGAEFRKAFISYVKGGSWLESVRRLVPTLNKGLSHDQRLALEKGSPLYEYKRAESADGWYEEVMCSEGQTISKKLSMSAGNSVRDGSAKERFVLVSGRDEQDAFGECYARLDDCACFTPTELVSLMLNAVYPLYLASPDYLRFLKYGCEWGDEESSVASASVVSGVSLTANEAAAKHLKRAQEILLSTAAYFDESQLLELLQCPRWEEELTHALQVHRLPISIVDLSEASRPFVYENRAFLRMTGYSDDQIHLKPWSMLAGANTEASQTALLEGAWKAQEPCKVVHTHYNRKQQPFQDFVASRPIGKYAVNVHFQVYKGCDLEPLKVSA
jgi:PAS domain-containing protein